MEVIEELKAIALQALLEGDDETYQKAAEMLLNIYDLIEAAVQKGEQA